MYCNEKGEVFEDDGVLSGWLVGKKEVLAQCRIQICLFGVKQSRTHPASSNHPRTFHSNCYASRSPDLNLILLESHYINEIALSIQFRSLYWLANLSEGFR